MYKKIAETRMIIHKLNMLLIAYPWPVIRDSEAMGVFHLSVKPARLENGMNNFEALICNLYSTFCTKYSNAL